MSPNCTQCKHYFITFDQSAPKGCRIYKIKSTKLPSIIVKQANNGSECIGFEPKPKNQDPNKQEEKKADFNDKKYWKA